MTSANFRDQTFPDGVDDTPHFRLRLSELEGDGKRLRERCLSLVSGFRRYKEAIANLSQAQVALATLLQDFYAVDHVDSEATGNVPIAKFVGCVKELAQCYNMLETQVEISAEEVQQKWVDGLLSTSRESHKQYERYQADMEEAQHKYLGLKQTTKREVVERSCAELQAVKQAALDARYDVTRQLHQVECKRRYAFLEVLLGTMDAHKKALSQSQSILERLDNAMASTRNTVQLLRDDEASRTAALSKAILSAKNASRSRDAAAAEDIQQASTQASTSAGPLQMAANQQLTQSIREDIAVTLASGGQDVRDLKKGYLQKKSLSAGGKLVHWKRRFFVLDSLGRIYYYSQKDTLLNRMMSKEKNKPQYALRLMTSTVKMDDEDPGTRFAFRLVSPDGILCLQAESAAERTEWIEAIQAIRSFLLNGEIEEPSKDSLPASISTGGAPAGHGSGSGGRHHRRSLSVGTPLADTNMAAVAAMAENFATAGQSPPQSSMSLGGVAGSTPPKRRTPYNSIGSAAELTALETASPAVLPLDRLRRPAGNLMCADCGCPDPDWASLNLAILICIECSGLHRQLGVQVSKVRSCTLDVKVWEPIVFELFDAVGNDFANSVWEANITDLHGGTSVPSGSILPFPPLVEGEMSYHRADSQASSSGGFESPIASSRSALPSSANLPRPSVGGDDWVWCEDDDEAPPVGSTSALKKKAAVIEDRSSKGLSNTKPTMRSSLTEKQRFVVEKYVSRRFVVALEPVKALQLLWDALEQGSVKLAVRALAGGADVTAPCRFPKAFKLAQQTKGMMMSPGAVSGAGAAQQPSGRGDVTVLHCAASSCNAVCMELLLQNSAPLDPSDSYGRTPLHYCILYGASQSAKLLLKRGANSRATDRAGNTAFDIAMSRGRVEDEELFVLLTTGSPTK